MTQRKINLFYRMDIFKRKLTVQEGSVHRICHCLVEVLGEALRRQEFGFTSGGHEAAGVYYLHRHRQLPLAKQLRSQALPYAPCQLKKNLTPKAVEKLEGSKSPEWKPSSVMSASGASTAFASAVNATCFSTK